MLITVLITLVWCTVFGLLVCKNSKVYLWKNFALGFLWGFVCPLIIAILLLKLLLEFLYKQCWKFADWIDNEVEENVS
jgi:hypothetical protein